MFVYGSADANIDLTRKDNPYAFHLKGEQTERLEIFLRNFDRGVLVRDPVDNKIFFYRWDEITSISKSATEISGPMLCWIFPSWCKRAPPITP